MQIYSTPPYIVANANLGLAETSCMNLPEDRGRFVPAQQPEQLHAAHVRWLLMHAFSGRSQTDDVEHTCQGGCNKHNLLHALSCC